MNTLISAGAAAHRGAQLFRSMTSSRLSLSLTGDTEGPRGRGRDVKPIDLDAAIGDSRRNKPDPRTGGHEMLLYVSAGSLPCARAERTLRDLLRQYPPDAIHLRVIDVASDMRAVERDRIVYTPTLICRGARGDTRVLGDLSNVDILVEVLNAMGIQPL